METITSTSNAKIKQVKSLLKSSKTRREEELFVVEGPRMVFEVNVEDFSHVFVSEKFLENPGEFQDEYDGLIAILGESMVDIVSDSAFASMSETKTPQGILALVKMNPVDVSIKKDGAYILLEDVSDPGNMGTIIRTAEAAGMDGIILSPNCVDIYSPKVVRSTMGSIFRVPIYACIDNDEWSDTIDSLKSCGISLYGAALILDAKPYDFCEMRCGCGIFIGNEAKGLSDDILSKVEPLYIPMCGEVESLNAAVAASVLMYEVSRQRRIG